MSLVTYTCGICGAERQLKFRPGKVNLNKDCHSCAAKKINSGTWLTKHGGYKTRLYQVWCGIKQRCYWPMHISWKDYGGKGITMCAEWRDSFAAFRDWAVAAGYIVGLVIDRKENSQGYSPDNCRWATYDESGQNTSHTRLTIAGVCVIRDLARLGVSNKLLAALYQIDDSTVVAVKYRHTWKDAEAQLRYAGEAA